MRDAVGLRDRDHALQAGDTRRDQEVIIRITEDARVGPIDCTTKSTILEDIEEITAIKTIGSSSQNLPLATTIGNGETGGDFIVVNNIAELSDVNVDNEPEEDEADDHHLAEKNGEFTKVEGFGLVLRAGIHIGPVPEEVVHCLNDCPGTHRGGDTSLVAELEVVESHLVTKKANRDPIKLF